MAASRNFPDVVECLESELEKIKEEIRDARRAAGEASQGERSRPFASAHRWHVGTRELELYYHHAEEALRQHALRYPELRSNQ